VSSDRIQAGAIASRDAAWSDLNFPSLCFVETLLCELNGWVCSGRHTCSCRIDAASFQASATVNGSFIYLKSQYFCGCLMLRAGYRFSGFHHILAAPSRLA
jgi:hypothetical protein